MVERVVDESGAVEARRTLLSPSIRLSDLTVRDRDHLARRHTGTRLAGLRDEGRNSGDLLASRDSGPRSDSTGVDVAEHPDPAVTSLNGDGAAGPAVGGLHLDHRASDRGSHRSSGPGEQVVGRPDVTIRPGYPPRIGNVER